MTQTFTQSDVIRYVYEETTNEENTQIEEALVYDQDLLSFYLDSIELKQMMHRIERNPSDSVIERILAFSQNYNNSTQPAYA